MFESRYIIVPEDMVHPNVSRETFWLFTLKTGCDRMKKARKSRGSVVLTRTLMRPLRASKHEEGAVLHAGACKTSGIRMVEAL